MAIENERSVASEAQSASVAEVERTVAELWQEALQMQDLPCADDDFFGLGGDSMTMVMVEFRIMEEFGVQLPGGTILGARTVRELSAVVAEAATALSAPQ